MSDSPFLDVKAIEEATTAARDPEKFRLYAAINIATMRAELRNLVGNGQPGRVGSLEKKVRQHDRALWLFTGMLMLATWFFSTFVK